MKQTDWRQVVGLSLHILVGSLMALAGALVIASGWARLMCLPLPGVVEMAVQIELSDHLLPRLEAVDVAVQFDHCLFRMIAGVGLLATGLLLIAPNTSVFGALSASSLWGAVVCLRMTQGESYLLQSALLVLTWTGVYLRNPMVLGNLWRCQKRAETI